MRMSYVRLLVSDYPACFRFYRDVLGFTPTWGEEDGLYAEFDTGEGARLAINSRKVVADVLGTADADPTLPAQDRFQVIFEVPQGDPKAVDAVAAKVTAHGIELLTSPSDYPDWGVRACHFRDPDGYLVEVNQLLG
jgi:catechol 2,3-dioxygenase-like lactoylglutathione lyase family enzyme